MVKLRCYLKFFASVYLPVIIFAIVVFFALKLRAQQPALLEKQTIISKVVLATGTQYSPYVDADLPDKGWSTSIITAVFKQQNIALSIEEFPWSRALENAKLIAHDGAFPFVMTEKRSKNFYYSDAINYVPVKIVVKENIDAVTLKGLKIYTFCLPYGYSSTTEMIGVVTASNTTRAPTTRDCFDKVINGWADVVLVNQYSKILQEEKYKQLKLLPIEVSKEPLYFIVGKSHPNAKALIALFNQGLNAIKHNQVLDDINRKFELLLFRL